MVDTKNIIFIEDIIINALIFFLYFIIIVVIPITIITWKRIFRYLFIFCTMVVLVARRICKASVAFGLNKSVDKWTYTVSNTDIIV